MLGGGGGGDTPDQGTPDPPRGGLTRPSAEKAHQTLWGEGTPDPGEGTPDPPRWGHTRLSPTRRAHQVGHALDVLEWTNALILLFSLPVSNGKLDKVFLDIVFSQLKRVKLTTETLNVLLTVVTNDVSPEYSLSSSE